MTRSSAYTWVQPVSTLLPTFVAHAGRAPEDIVGVHGTQFVHQAVFVVPPERVLPIRLLGIDLGGVP